MEDSMECIPNRLDPQIEVEMRELTRRINDFLMLIKFRDRSIFIKRYWYAEKVGDIAKEFHMTEANVKVNLHRTRRKLRIYLQNRGWLNEE